VRGATTPEAWHLAPPGDASAQGFAVGPPYQNESSYSLISPKMKLADRSKVKLTWAERTNTEDGFDYLSVQWSSDSYSWNQVTAHSGINAEYPLFTPREASFIAPKGALYIRFRMTSDQLVNGEGVNVDNVLVQR
jgi:hypothetical protein